MYVNDLGNVIITVCLPQNKMGHVMNVPLNNSNVETKGNVFLFGGSAIITRTATEAKTSRVAVSEGQKTGSKKGTNFKSCLQLHPIAIRGNSRVLRTNLITQVVSRHTIIVTKLRIVTMVRMNLIAVSILSMHF
jgi:hypothetical protein